MRIKEFAEKYGVDRRSIDYWTNIGLLHAEGMEGDNYCRVYGLKAEEEIKKILIAKAMGASPLEDYVDMLNHLPDNVWDILVRPMIQNEMRKACESYERALKYVDEIVKGT